MNGYRSLNSNQSSLQPEQSLNNTLHFDQITISKEAKNKVSSSKNDIDHESTQNHTKEDSGLSIQDLAQLRTLKRRDMEVRSHEQAHLSAAGKYAKGGASFVYQKGPDGGKYAIGGEVSIDISSESSPEETISKMQTIKRAALAPLNPSPADRGIAAQAASKEASARQQLIREQHESLEAAAAVAETQGFEYLKSQNTNLFETVDTQDSGPDFKAVA